MNPAIKSYLFLVNIEGIKINVVGIGFPKQIG